MKLLRAIYAFCFYRCAGCGKRTSAKGTVCNDECEKEAIALQSVIM